MSRSLEKMLTTSVRKKPRISERVVLGLVYKGGKFRQPWPERRRCVIGPWAMSGCPAKSAALKADARTALAD